MEDIEDIKKDDFNTSVL